MSKMYYYYISACRQMRHFLHEIIPIQVLLKIEFQRECVAHEPLIQNLIKFNY